MRKRDNGKLGGEQRRASGLQEENSQGSCGRGESGPLFLDFSTRFWDITALQIVQQQKKTQTQTILSPSKDVAKGTAGKLQNAALPQSTLPQVTQGLPLLHPSSIISNAAANAKG